MDTTLTKSKAKSRPKTTSAPTSGTAQMLSQRPATYTFSLSRWSRDEKTQMLRSDCNITIDIPVDVVNFMGGDQSILYRLQDQYLEKMGLRQPFLKAVKKKSKSKKR